MNLQVLWVDDMPSDAFINEAFKYGLSLTVCTSVNGGIQLLKDKSKVWDAIILDANCKLTDNEQEQPSLNAYRYSLVCLYRW